MMRRMVLAAALAAALTLQADAETPATINLRDYWILAEIRNPATGERAAFRVDCSDQGPLLCKENLQPTFRLSEGFHQRRRAQEKGQPEGPWPEFIRAEVVPFFPGIVGYVVSGAGGFAVGFDDHLALAPKAAPFAELRRPAGFAVRISTVRGGERVDNSDVRLTMWLVTPAELAARDAAKAGLPAGKARPALGRAPRR